MDVKKKMDRGREKVEGAANYKKGFKGLRGTTKHENKR
jgi:hypothetical protein